MQISQVKHNKHGNISMRVKAGAKVRLIFYCDTNAGRGV